jgi:hypothetical protein
MGHGYALVCHTYIVFGKLIHGLKFDEGVSRLQMTVLSIVEIRDPNSYNNEPYCAIGL